MIRSVSMNRRAICLRCIKPRNNHTSPGQLVAWTICNYYFTRKNAGLFLHLTASLIESCGLTLTHLVTSGKKIAKSNLIGFYERRLALICLFFSQIKTYFTDRTSLN